MKKHARILLLTVIAGQALFFNACNQGEVDEKAVKKEADETASELIDQMDDSFSEDTTVITEDTLNQP